MKLPTLEDPARYAGLYVFDFGAWCAVGYTAEEIAALYESERYRTGKAYRIRRAAPDGQIELQGVTPERFELESGVFCYRDDEDAARSDFAALQRLAEQTPPPTRAFAHLADRGEEPLRGRYVVALIYPAEHDEVMGRWLLEANYAGGDTVEGGPSCVTNYYEDEKQILDRAQLWSSSTISSRSRDEIYASVRQAVQR